MRAGSLRHKLIVQKHTQTIDSYGQPTDTWNTFATVYGQVEPLTGREYWNSKQVNAEVTGKVRIRYYPGITAEMRLKENLGITDESITLDGTTAQALNVKNYNNSQVTSVVVTDSTGDTTYSLTTDYTLSTNDDGYTTVTRVADGSISDGEDVLVDYSYYKIYEIEAVINVEGRSKELELLVSRK